MDGHGMSLTVYRGQLQLRDGVGPHRRERTLPRTEHTVTHIVIIGQSGHLTVDALRWCAEHSIEVSHIGRDGNPIIRGVPAGRTEPYAGASLRRKQCAAAGTDTGMAIVRLILGAKLEGQAYNAEQVMLDRERSGRIRGMLASLDTAHTVGESRGLRVR